MKFWDHGSAQCRRLEHLLCATIVVLKLFVLYGVWGKLQGFDAVPWLEVFRVTHWFEPLPQPRALFASYHPPLSYLLARTIFWALPNEAAASQVLSTLALIGGFFGLRAALRRIGWLYSLPGLWLLYGGFSMPLFVWLAVETGYDSLTLTWYMGALAVFVSLFWRPVPWVLGCRVRTQLRLLALALLLA